MSSNNIFFIHGSESLLRSDLRTELKNNAKKQGFSEYNLLFIDKDFDFGYFEQELLSQSIFSDKKIIDCLILQKIDANFVTKLLEIINAAQNNPDVFIIFSYNELIKNKAILNNSCIKNIPVYEIRSYQYLPWLKKRISQYGLNFEQDAFELFVNKNQGNLLNTDQELKKLSFIYDSNTKINISLLKNILSDNANYNIFDLSDNFVNKNIKATAQILNNLKKSNIAVNLPLWAITEDIRALAKIKNLLEQNKKLVDIFKTLKIPAYKTKNYSAAVNKWQLKSLFAMLRDRYNLEKIIKNYDLSDSAFVEFERWVISNITLK